MRYLALITLLTTAAFAQVSDGITTSVSRTVNITPDEAAFTVVVNTTLDTTQDQVVQAFHDAGIQNLAVIAVGVFQAYPSGRTAAGQSAYQVSFTTAPAALASYSKKLDAMNSALPDGFTSVQYSAALNASQSAVDTAHQAVLPQLLRDAQTRAQALAGASGLKLGPITGITESNNSVGVLSVIQASFAGTFSSSNGSSGTQYIFYATVKFAAQ